MAEKYKKIDRKYVLSDSSVNVYGFRLLTSGYQLDAFQKNPIGYYMHRRDDGIVLKWEDLIIENDQVVGTPVINLTNGRGAQTYDEAENGFLNAASVGHIVVLEYSTDKEMMLPGQTGPTITKWYNKECSLVDIPGNGNALTQLYDANENALNLVDLGKPLPMMPDAKETTFKRLCEVLQLTDGGDEKLLIEAVKALADKTGKLELEIKVLGNDKYALQQQIDEINAIRNKAEVSALLERALEDKKITIELKAKLAADYASNVDGLRGLLAAMPAYRSIVEMLRNKQEEKTEAQWGWDDYEKNDPAGKKLKDLRGNDPVRYKELFDKKFNP